MYSAVREWKAKPVENMCTVGHACFLLFLIYRKKDRPPIEIYYIGIARGAIPNREMARKKDTCSFVCSNGYAYALYAFCAEMVRSWVGRSVVNHASGTFDGCLRRSSLQNCVFVVLLLLLLLLLLLGVSRECCWPVLCCLWDVQYMRKWTDVPV